MKKRVLAMLLAVLLLVSLLPITALAAEEDLPYHTRLTRNDLNRLSFVTSEDTELYLLPSEKVTGLEQKIVEPATAYYPVQLGNNRIQYQQFVALLKAQAETTLDKRLADGGLAEYTSQNGFTVIPDNGDGEIACTKDESYAVYRIRYSFENNSFEEAVANNGIMVYGYAHMMYMGTFTPTYGLGICDYEWKYNESHHWGQCFCGATGNNGEHIYDNGSDASCNSGCGYVRALYDVTVEGGTGSGGYAEGAEVTVSANVPEGYAFVNWSSEDGVIFADSTSANTTFIMPAKGVTVTALREAAKYTVTASASNDSLGSVTGGGTYVHGESVTLAATPAEGYRLVGWKEADTQVSTDNPYTFTANADRSLVAVFELAEYEVTVSAGPADGGTVTGGGTYAHGDTVTLTFAPADGYELGLVSVMANGSNVTTTDKGNGKHTFTMPAGDVTVSATFSLKSTEPATGYDLWVGGEEVTSDKLSGADWAYDPTTKTLTLTNANISGGMFGIASGDDLKIVFSGTNTIDGAIMAGEQTVGFYKLTFSGTGSLTATTGNPNGAIMAGSITLGDGLQITEGGQVQTQSGMAYIGNNSGTPAASVTLASSTPADTTAPALGSWAASRSSDTEAGVSFASNEAGTYYYLVAAEDSVAPSSALVIANGTSGSCVNEYNTIFLTGLTAGAKKVYLVVKDAAGNVSNVLAIDIAAYVAAPELTPGEVSRTSDAEASVKFTSSQAGQYTYYVVPSGSTDTIGVTKNGNCVAGENTITLTDLTAGAKDIHIRVTNSYGKYSDLKITIPAYEASAGTFTVVYKTNADVEMGRVEYEVGGSNAFPAPSQFGTLFADFMARAKQKGSVYLASQPWYTDAAFTTAATFPAGEAGQTYTVYCKLTTNLYIESMQNRANDVSYSQVYDRIYPAALWVSSYGGPDGRSDVYNGNSPRMVWEKQNTDGTWSEAALSNTTMDGSQTWPNASFFSGVADNGVYRLKYFVYTAKDNSGAELFYDYAFDPTGGTYAVKINPVELTISGVAAVDRPADGTTSVALTGGTLNGVLTQDVGKVSFELGSGTIADAAAGENKAVTTNIQLTGEKAANYTLIQPTDVTVNITDAPAASITGVTIAPTEVTVIKGETQQFIATVTGTGSYNNTVSWSVSGNGSPNTTISAEGLLTVAADETEQTLRVVATANGDSNKFAYATVTVEQP